MTATLGTRAGRRLGATSDAEIREAEGELGNSAKLLTRGAILGGLSVAVLLVLLARPTVSLFLPGGDPAAAVSAVLLTVSCAGGFVFLATFKQLKAAKGKMQLTNVGENFMEVLENTGLDAVFDIL